MVFSLINWAKFPKNVSPKTICVYHKWFWGVFQSQYFENIATYTKMGIFGEKKGLTLRGEFFFLKLPYLENRF